jgi:hypothetical protein
MVTAGGASAAYAAGGGGELCARGACAAQCGGAERSAPKTPTAIYPPRGGLHHVSNHQPPHATSAQDSSGPTTARHWALMTASCWLQATTNHSARWSAPVLDQHWGPRRRLVPHSCDRRNPTPLTTGVCGACRHRRRGVWPLPEMFTVSAAAEKLPAREHAHPTLYFASADELPSVPAGFPVDKVRVRADA